MRSTKEIGDHAESVAEGYFYLRGYRRLARNYRQKYGEIDLVLERPGELLFVEVKGRSAFRADEAWSPRWRAKKRKLRRVVETFLAENPDASDRAFEIRFEIVFVTQGRVSERFEGEPLV